MSVNLGDKVREDITGFEGIATSRTVFMTGCARIGVQAKVDKDGKVPHIEAFDEDRLTVTEPAAIKVPAYIAPERRGGDDNRDQPSDLR